MPVNVHQQPEVSGHSKTLPTAVLHPTCQPCTLSGGRHSSANVTQHNAHFDSKEVREQNMQDPCSLYSLNCCHCATTIDKMHVLSRDELDISWIIN